ncbi:hypothetical protein GCM10011351_24920 [Paraliobacillus quinghaiensis]|uniref:Uncharacterized protein n=1 Tax=Paraliobacillus quinghaiensis TaxID=470815 RepID=A0A917TU88_9BACI|nr:hypothetical protein [Paraliobacillus quinghaiensis]GGM37746.1 hypothetical protein GCM10011351_24920 [Paraliobacillus quinghaiensis]
MKKNLQSQQEINDITVLNEEEEGMNETIQLLNDTYMQGTIDQIES